MNKAAIVALFIAVSLQGQAQNPPMPKETAASTIETAPRESEDIFHGLCDSADAYSSAREGEFCNQEHSSESINRSEDCFSAAVARMRTECRRTEGNQACPTRSRKEIVAASRELRQLRMGALTSSSQQPDRRRAERLRYRLQSSQRFSLPPPKQQFLSM